MGTRNLSSTGPVFVVGVFRSGTSLLYSLLNQHSRIALMYECDVWDFPEAFQDWRFRGEWLMRQEFYNQTLSRHRLILGERLNGLENIRTPDELYQCHSQQKGAALWGEKSPVYSLRLARLGRRYPEGAFILIWRDPVEVYRSMKVAGRKSPFFSRPCMFHRLIYHQERMIRQAAQLERTGARVLHVCYDRLVDQTAEVCQEICQFLRVEFEPQMTGLKQADFSAVYQAPQHDFLRRGVIERQALADDVVEPARARKLDRFRQRWERLARRPLSLKAMPNPPGEPSLAEVGFHQAAGLMIHAGDEFRRLVFEFLPLSWLRTYRLFRNWLLARDGVERPSSLGQEFQQDHITVLAGFVLLGIVAYVDYATGPEISCGPLYLIPCGALALIAGRSWATLMAAFCAISITCLREGLTHHFQPWLTTVIAWNLAMRFVFFEVFVLLLDRIRRELGARGQSSGDPEK